MLLLILFFTGLFAGAVDAVAGGGGLISLPVLLSTGLAPQTVFGTNKFQSCVGLIVSLRKFYQQGFISLSKISKGIIFALLGSIAGAELVQSLSTDFLRVLVPILLLIILAYTLLSPKLGHSDLEPRVSESWFYPAFGFLLGFYDGFFGPGVGSFWMFSITFFLGYNLLKASAYTKVFNFNSNIIATVCFALGGNIDYRFALCMAAGQMIGARLGAHFAIKKGAKVIRPIFLIIVFATISSLIYRNYQQYLQLGVLDYFTQMPSWWALLIGLSLALSCIIFRWQKRRRVAAS